MRLAIFFLFMFCVSAFGATPTARLVTIKPSGGNYTSLSAAEDGEDNTGDLVTRNETMTFECYAMSDTTAVTFNGWTTGSANWIKITVASGNRHDGKWNTSAYRLETTATAMNLYSVYTTVEWLQISVTASSGTVYGIMQTAGYTGSQTIQKCIIKGIISGTGVGVGIYTVSANIPISVWNCVIYDWIQGTSASRGLANNSATATVLNCTFNNCYHAVRSVSGVINITNCISASSGADDWSVSSGTLNPDYLCSNLSSCPGTHSISSHAVSFVGAEDFHISATEAGATPTVVGVGLSDPSGGGFSDDIDGVTRSGNWTIGADQYVATAATKPPSTYLLKGLLR